MFKDYYLKFKDKEEAIQVLRPLGREELGEVVFNCHDYIVEFIGELVKDNKVIRRRRSKKTPVIEEAPAVFKDYHVNVRSNIPLKFDDKYLTHPKTPIKEFE
jgi:hypothetical protein